MPEYVPLWPGGPVFAQAENQRLSTDCVLLADFVRIGAAKRGIDLGCASGAIALLLLERKKTLRMTGLELDAAAAQTARDNMARNGLEERLIPIRGDLREIRSLLPHGSFRHVVCNPPYYPVNSGFHAHSEAQAVARTELCCTMENVLDAAAWLLPTGGTLWLVHKPERLADLLCGLRAHRLEPKVLRLVAHNPAAEPSLVLIKAVMGGKAALEVRPILFLQTPDGSPTEEYRRIYHL